MEIPDWRRLNEHLVNKRGPLVYIYIHNGTVQYGPLKTLANTKSVHMGIMEKPL